MPKTSLKERLNLEELYTNFLGLEARERVLALAGVGLVLLLIILLPISCASSKISKKEQNVLSHEKNMDDLMSKLQDYQTILNRMKSMETQWAGRSKISLSTTLESLSAQSGLDKNIDTIKEQPPATGDVLEEHAADVRLSRVPLAQAIDYLYKIENSSQGALKIKKLQIKPRFDNRQLFDLSFQVSTYVLKEGAGT
jgi:type II secretory pathway component PulM